MTGPQCPQQTRLAEYATGKLPEPEASSIAQHLEQCGDCEATIQRLEAASDTFVAGLKAEAPVAEPYTDEAPYRRAAEQAAQLSATTTPPSPLAGEGPGVRGAAAEGSSPPVPSSAPSSGLRPPSPVAGAGVRPAAPVEKSVTKGTSKLGPYQLLAKLGEGGMGAVYKARHEHLEKIVAIKILPKKAMQDAAAVARFRREMKVVGALHHPNIVGAHDAGEALGVHYLVMEYVAGSDLSSLLKKQGPLPLDRAISYTRQAARGLAFAHAKGVIHRDIKPANLLVDGEGTLKILDLGLARLDDGDLHNAAAREGLTQTGQVMGTVDYMAPEQAFDTHRADAKADVYSLGCSLYRLLTGQNVFGGDTVVQKILAHREQPIPSLRVARPDVPPRLDTLYQRMIAKRPEDRPTMAEIAGELESLERGVAEAPAESIVIDTSKAASPERKRRDASRAAGSARPAPTAPSPARGPRASAPRGPGRRPPAWLLAAAAGGAALVVCLGVWIIVRDPQGNEIARLQAPDGSSVTVQPHAPQPHEPRPSGSGFVPTPLAGTGPAATGATPPPPALNPATIDFAAHRAEAEWLLSAGADYVMIAPPHDLTAETSVKQLADLPQQPFVLTVITLYNAKRRPDEARYRAWAKLTSLRGLSYLSGPTLTDRAVVELAGLPRLEHFGFVSQTNVTNEGLRAIAQSKTLRRLDLHSSPQFDDASLAILAPLTELTSLDLRGWRLGAPGLRELTRFEKLEVLLIEPRVSTGLGQLKALTRLGLLHLEGPFVTDAALQELVGFLNLKSIPLVRTQVTPAGVAAFRKAGGAWVDLRTSAGEPDLPPPAPLAAAGPATTGAVPPPLAVAPFDAKQARTHQEAWARHLGMTIESTNSVGMKVILIPPGEFLMGSTDEQVEAAVTPVEAANDRGLQDRVRRTEQPQHKVLITRPFLMSATEVTIGQFKKFSAATGYVTDAERRAAAAKAAPAQAGGKPPLTYLTPGYPVQDDSPAGAISWNDAVAYCEWLTAQDQTLLPLGEDARRADEGPPPGPSPSSGSLRSPPSPGGRRVTYRLPTEAEWEYACRAGTTTLYSFGDDSNELLKYGWHSKNGPHESHPVGTRLANPFGLFDMHGNLYEWCDDWSHEKWYETSGSPSGLSVDPVGPPTGTRRVLRGGSHNYSATYARSAYRDENEASDGNAYYGFRVVVELPAPLAGTSPAATGAALTPYEILTSPDYEWTPPENLGPAVNTQHAQGYPALSADGLRLIYHSFVAGGSGLYEATRANVAEPFGRGEPLGPEFGGDNSAGFGTALSGDGLTLLFGSPRPGGPRGESSINLWQATRPTPASPFAKPACLTTLSSAELDGAPSVSSDGLTVWFRSDRPKSLSRQGGYWTSRRASLAVEFEPPAPFELPLVPGANGYGHVAGIAISADQRVLLFSPKMDGVVEHDLYLSARPTPQEPFGAPVNLGPAINSATMDVQPTLSADGTILVFSSDRPGGVGEYDLWMTRRVRKATPSVGDYALDFDGVDDLVRIQNYQYVAPSPLTFEAVVAARPPRSQVDALIFAAGSGSNGPRLVCSSRSWSFIYPASPANGSVYAGSDSPVEFGSAVHLAGVWDGREVRLYVDGKKQRQTATPTLRPLDPASVVLGRIGGGGIHGRLQEVRISKVARYTTDFVPDHRFDADDDTEVLYHFDEGAGDVLHDASGNGHDGRIVGATWVRADGSPISPPSPLAGEGLGVRGPAPAGPPATGPALAPSTPPPVTLPGVDPVRQAVEYLLSRQVRIDALVAGRRINLKPGDAVPPGPIEVSGVHLNGQASYNRDDFAWLPRLPGLQALFVNSTGFDDACLAYLDGQTKIVTVWVDQTRLSPAGHAELVRKLPALQSINLGGPGCTDETLAALHAATQLKYLEFMSPSAITPAGYLALRRALPGCNIKPHVPSMPPADFPTGPLPAASPASPPAAATGPAGTAPKQLAYLDPAFQAWVEATRKLPAEQQLEEVSKKLMELNPGFDGQLLAADVSSVPKIDRNTVISLGLVSDAVTDLSPLRALKGLVYFACHGTKFGGGQFADLAPLEGLPLESFITQDTRIADLSPLATCKSLRLVKLSSTHATAEQVDRLRAALPKCDVQWDGRTDAPAVERRIAEWALERRWGLQIMIDRVPQVITDRGQLPSEPFWVNSLSMQVSAQDADLARLAPCIGLTHVNVVEAPISDAGLAHLKDAKSLVRLSLAGTRVTDAGLAHLAGLSKLVDLDLRRTRVTPAGVAALQKALRGCKILWDGSAER